MALSFLKRFPIKISRFFNRCFRFLGLIPNIAKNNIDKRDKLKTKETKGDKGRQKRQKEDFWTEEHKNRRYTETKRDK